MGRARDSQGRQYNHAGSTRLCVQNGCDRGWSSCPATPGIEVRGSLEMAGTSSFALGGAAVNYEKWDATSVLRAVLPPMLQHIR